MIDSLRYLKDTEAAGDLPMLPNYAGSDYGPGKTRYCGYPSPLGWQKMGVDCIRFGSTVGLYVAIMQVAVSSC